jgi:hypothetical protein
MYSPIVEVIAVIVLLSVTRFDNSATPIPVASPAKAVIPIFVAKERYFLFIFL